MTKVKSGKEAIEYLLDTYPKLNKSIIGKMLGISSSACYNYREGVKVSAEVAEMFIEEFDIEIAKEGVGRSRVSLDLEDYR